MATLCFQSSETIKYIEDRKKRNSEFAENDEKGYQYFNLGVMLSTLETFANTLRKRPTISVA